MTNIINTQLNSSNNIIAAKKLSDKNTGKRNLTGKVRAPSYFPSYSIEKSTKEADEFRKSVYLEKYKREQNIKRKQNFISLIKTGLYIGAVYWLISKINISKFEIKK